MKLYIDENLSPLVSEPVQRVYRRHQFRIPAQEHLHGVLDIPLFQDLRSREFDAIITHDVRQLEEREDERAALRYAGLHWIGLADPDEAGVNGLALQAGALLAAFPRILPELSTVPSAFHVDVDRVSSGMITDAYPL